MQAPLEIRYAGVVIGRAQEVRETEAEGSFFLPGKEPMPVGTVVRLRSGDRETPARVLRAVESADPLLAGMQVRLIGEAEEVSADWIPASAPVAAKPKPGTPTPLVEVDARRTLQDSEPPPVAPVPESAGVPEPVPVAVGSSLTGALENAAAAGPAPGPAEDNGMDVIIDTPPVVLVESIAETKAKPEAVVDKAPGPAPQEATAGAPQEVTVSAPVETSPATSGEQAIGSSENSGDSATTAATGPTSEELPPARPITGPSGRRKTKRRKY